MKSSSTEKLTKTGKWEQLFSIGFVLACIILCSLPVMAQPSGGPYGPTVGPYGPTVLIYDLPQGPGGRVYYAAPDGNPEESGGTLEKPTTIESAIKRAVTGDAIILRGGTYRTGNLQFNQWITIESYMDEQPVLKGTYIAKDWQSAGQRLWKTSWSRLFPEKPADWWRDRGHTPLHRFNNDMVFVDGKFLQSAGEPNEVDENSFYIDYDAKEVYIGIDPNGKTIEITAFDSALTRVTGKCHGRDSSDRGPTIRGIKFTQYAYRAIEIQGKDPEGLSDESKYGKDVVGTTIENCSITFCSRVAAYLRGDKMTIRNCLVSDTSTEGLFILSSNDVLLEKNIFRRNNIENIEGYFPAAVKIFNQCHRVTCRDNKVTDQPNSNGIWYDVGNVDGVFIDNWIEDVGKTSDSFNYRQFWPSQNGFFFEISKGAICAGNVFVNCDHGIYVINSSNVEMYQNTLINSTVCIMRTPRSATRDYFGWHASTGPDVDQRQGHVFVNNLLTGLENFNRPLLALSQTDSLCEQLNQPQVKQMDYNVYVRRSKAEEPLILWSPADDNDCQAEFATPEELHKLHPQFAANSKYFVEYSGPLFKNAGTGDYRLLEAFEGSKAATQLPSEISKLLGLKTDERFTGAYPPIR
jgi:parallel beta-helix repeat protein